MIIIRVILAAINASFSHTPLALYALKAYCADAFREAIEIESFTVNHSYDYILRRLYERKPDILGFSCAIWNIKQTLRVAADLRKLLPNIVIIFGGPEVADGYDDYLLSGFANAVVYGEGEKPLKRLLSRYAEATAFPVISFEGIGGVAWRDGSTVRRNPPGEPLALSDLPFPYPIGLEGLENKIIYYEASRGCVFHCGYCLSSAGEGLRLRPLDDIKRDLRIFLNACVKRVKFTDRTFNADAAFAMAIWQFLIENDNGVTNFHFEIAADLLDADALRLLGRARPALFQFEIGIQSINETALAAVNRASNLRTLFENTAHIRAFRNIHLHLDLIAGLPGENYDSFKASFNQVYAAAPDQLQLGFLKLLNGTPLRVAADRLGLVFSDHPPYEILGTPVLTYDDILQLKAVEDAVEIFHNSGKFTAALRYLMRFFPSPFDFFEQLARFWYTGRYHEAPHSKSKLYEILYRFSEIRLPEGESANILSELLRFDWLANENEKSLPAILTPPEEARRRARALMAGRDTLYERVEFFNIHILPWLAGKTDTPGPASCFLLFTYPEPGRQNPLTLLSRIKEIYP